MSEHAGRRVRLIHWNQAEAAERAKVIASDGWIVDASLPPGPVLFRELRQEPPALIVIDLRRLPSQGRDVALTIRHSASTRRVPIVFIEGDAVKTAGVRQHLPDAVFTAWAEIRAAMRRAIEHAPAEPVAPASAFAGYSGTPLPKKLGIKPGMTVGTVGAPADLPAILGPLPDGVALRAAPGGRCGLLLWFVRSQAELVRKAAAMAARAGDAPMWIAWEKQTARAAQGGVAPRAARVGGPSRGESAARTVRSTRAAPTEKSVRAAGLGVGMVDYKVCAIDATWSGLLFTRRRAAR